MQQRGGAACCNILNKQRMVGGFMQPALICKSVLIKSLTGKEDKGSLFGYKVNIQSNKHISKFCGLFDKNLNRVSIRARFAFSPYITLFP